MNNGQKVIKIFAIVLAVSIIASICEGIVAFVNFITYDEKDSTILVKNFEETYYGIDKIEIDSHISNIKIVEGNAFKVEATNLKTKLSSRKENNKLIIKEESKNSFNVRNNNGKILITVPYNERLSLLDINGGIGKTTIEDITSDELKIKTGVGELDMEDSIFYEADIKGGVGSTNIKSSTITNLLLEGGIGTIDIEAELIGNNKIKCGIGEMKISLLGNENNYTISTEKGIGSIKIDGEKYASGETFGNGSNSINLKGGIGAISVNFD